MDPLRSRTTARFIGLLFGRTKSDVESEIWRYAVPPYVEMQGEFNLPSSVIRGVSGGNDIATANGLRVRAPNMRASMKCDAFMMTSLCMNVTS